MSKHRVLAALATAVFAPEPAAAAVGLCQQLAVGEPSAAPSEVDARRAALASWTRLAEAHGPGYTRWAIAWGRRIECQRTADGGHSCRASGRPCTISQVPASGLPVLRRGD